MSDAVPATKCYRHPDREAAISCQRCGRTICPACMREAAVGFHCPECVAEGRRTTRQPRTFSGARLTGALPLVSFAVIAIDVVVFVAQLATGDHGSRIYDDGAMLSLSAFDPASGQMLTGVADGGYWRLLTAAFLHLNVLHLAVNMYSLYVFGPFVERLLGPTRFAISYLTAALVSSAFVYWLSGPLTLTVGASGAIFGLFAICLVLLVRAKQDIRMLLVVLAINAVISLQGNISWQGHLGGFVSGLVIGGVFAYAPRARRAVWHWGVFSLLWIAVVVIVLARTASLT